ncbi:MAG: hypothetical protein BGO01_02385 [Armatimonadetes bacterium 55-13]|nr:hypothetical protein [Armatimonadota bacterium]ODU52828.1 MAG: hypothetical protein ABT09_02415 [bacterium SCN 57-13]OJU65776.1 MAG: hypothetical protein BGO01_02385 [Armatimonadetes bacterium 55-13]
MHSEPTPVGPSAPPSQTATEGKGSGIGEKKAISSQGADPRKVADRVYELMLEEVRNYHRRGLN